MRFAVLGLALLSCQPAFAEVPANCPADLEAVDASFTETLARLEAVGKADQAEKCAAIRHHLDVMSAARNVFARCLTGHALGENVGQIDASIEDFRYVLADQKCE